MNTSTVSEGSVTGAVRMWLRAEGLCALLLSVLLFGHSGTHWWVFGGLLLTPDLSMLFYLINPKIGGAIYNIVHSYLLPLSLAAIAVAFDQSGMLPYLFIWAAHIGMDRALGYGLKYPTAFGRTHLGILGRGLPESTN